VHLFGVNLFHVPELEGFVEVLGLAREENLSHIRTRQAVRYFALALLQLQVEPVHQRYFFVVAYLRKAHLLVHLTLDLARFEQLQALLGQHQVVRDYGRVAHARVLVIKAQHEIVPLFLHQMSERQPEITVFMCASQYFFILNNYHAVENRFFSEQGSFNNKELGAWSSC